jgi:hypothetical protein
MGPWGYGYRVNAGKIERSQASLPPFAIGGDGAPANGNAQIDLLGGAHLDDGGQDRQKRPSDIPSKRQTQHAGKRQPLDTDQIEPEKTRAGPWRKEEAAGLRRDIANPRLAAKNGCWQDMVKRSNLLLDADQGSLGSFNEA